MTILATTRAPPTVISCVSQVGKANTARKVSTVPDWLGGLFMDIASLLIDTSSWLAGWMWSALMRAFEQIASVAVGKKGGAARCCARRRSPHRSSVNKLILLDCCSPIRLVLRAARFVCQVCTMGQSYSYKARVCDFISTEWPRREGREGADRA